jgi:hypothetical protein
MIKKWANEPGEFKIDLSRTDDGKLLDRHGQRLEVLEPIVYDGDLVISFRSTGYTDPGQRYGGPDGVGWAPYHEDNRTLERAFVTSGFETVSLSEAIQIELFELYRDRIEAVEIS